MDKTGSPRKALWMAVGVALACVWLSPAVLSQEAVVIEGSLADRTVNQEPVPQVLPEVVVKETVEYQLGDRKITINRVDNPRHPDPALLAETGALDPAERDAWLDSPDAAGWRAQADHETTHLVLSATVIDGRATLLRWRDEGREYEAWSNVDWRIMSGFQACRKGKRRFVTLMLTAFHQSGPPDANPAFAVPDDLPSGLANFILTKGEGAAETSSYEAIVALHELCRSDGERLLAAYQLREERRRQREADAAAHPVAPRDIVIHYWKKQPARKTEGGAR